MNISGILVRARVERFSQVLAELRRINGVEVHAAEAEGGKIVVTVEDGEGYNTEESLLSVYSVAHISDASLIYQYSDQDADGIDSIDSCEEKAA